MERPRPKKLNTNRPERGFSIMTQSDLIKFLSDRPAINLSKFAQECGISQAMKHYIAKKKLKLRADMEAQVIIVAKKYGN